MIQRDLRLSPNFTLGELLRSELAARMGIDNTPPEDVLAALRRTAQGLEYVRALLGVPVHVSSGYRCPELNLAVGSKQTSAHVRGQAADFEAPDYGTPLEVCRAIYASSIGFEQLIYEHTWVHISWPDQGEAPRRQVMTLMPDKTYMAGLGRPDDPGAIA